MSFEKPHDDHFEHADKTSPSLTELKAKEALATEHSLTTLEAVKAYPMAVFWSLMVSMCVIMEGYDTIL